VAGGTRAALDVGAGIGIMSLLPGGTSTDLLYSLSNGHGINYDAALQGLPRYLDAPPPDAAAGTPSPLTLSSFTRKLDENRVYTNGQGFPEPASAGTNQSSDSTSCGAYEFGASGYGHNNAPRPTYGVTGPAGGTAGSTAPGYGLPTSAEAAGGTQAMRGRFDGEAAYQSSSFQPYQRDTSPLPVGTFAPSSPMTMGRPSWDGGDYHRDGAGMPPIGAGNTAGGVFGGCGGLGSSISQPSYGVTTPAGGAFSFAPSDFTPPNVAPSDLAPPGMTAVGYVGPGNTLLEEARAAVGGLASIGSNSQLHRRDASPLPGGSTLPMAGRPGWDRAPQQWGQPELPAPFGEPTQPPRDAFNFPANCSYAPEPYRDGVPPYAPVRPSPRSSSQLEGRAGSPLPDGRSPHSASLLEGRSSSPLPAGRSVAASQLPQQEASMDVEHARVEGHGTAPSVAPASTPDPAAPMVGLTGAVDEPNTSALSSHALKQHVTNLLNGLDLQTVSLKTLRSMLEAHLKWPAGALEERKQDINAMVADFMHH